MKDRFGTLVCVLAFLFLASLLANFCMVMSISETDSKIEKLLLCGGILLTGLSSGSLAFTLFFLKYESQKPGSKVSLSLHQDSVISNMHVGTFAAKTLKDICKQEDVDALKILRELEFKAVQNFDNHHRPPKDDNGSSKDSEKYNQIRIVDKPHEKTFACISPINSFDRHPRIFVKVIHTRIDDGLQIVDAGYRQIILQKEIPEAQKHHLKMKVQDGSVDLYDIIDFGGVIENGTIIDFENDGTSMTITLHPKTIPWTELRNEVLEGCVHFERVSLYTKFMRILFSIYGRDYPRSPIAA